MTTPAPEHIVRTSHICKMIDHALYLASTVNALGASSSVMVGTHALDLQTVDSVLEKAVVDLRHAAAELEEERLSCRGWTQV